ncbi:MAG: aminotransferase class V-fold PLP-dependent enzyme, partial [Chloroflexi bacterium]|nr:aminotransferase class V-fold PLP-dependent enzyme [Chloroflexota bacterium]
MPRKSLLLVPGPTPVPEAVLRASAAPMVNHRGPEFAAVQSECYAALKQIFGTNGDVIAFPASGTGGLESAVVNTLSPGDRVLSCSVGAFGDRFAKIARSFGAEVESCAFEWGAAADPSVVAEKLRGAGTRKFKAVLITHNETSTGVVNDVRAIARLCREHGA